MHVDVTVTWSKSRSRSLSFSIWENSTFIRLSPAPFWRAAQDLWLITIVWDLVYSFSEPDFGISPLFGGHVTSKFAKCWHHQNPLGFISALPEARSLWLWLQHAMHAGGDDHQPPSRVIFHSQTLVRLIYCKGLICFCFIFVLLLAVMHRWSVVTLHFLHVDAVCYGS